MAPRQLKAKRFDIPLDERSDAPNATAVVRRFKPDQTLTRFNFGAPAGGALERRRAIAILGLTAIAAAGAFAQIISFAGIAAAAVTALAVVALIVFGNWVLNNSIDL